MANRGEYGKILINNIQILWGLIYLFCCSIPGFNLRIIYSKSEFPNKFDISPS